MSSHNENDQQVLSPNLYNTEDTRADQMPYPSRSSEQPTVIQGTNSAQFASPFIGGYFANLDLQSHQAPLCLGEQFYYSNSNVIGMPAYQIRNHNSHTSATYSEFRDFMNAEQSDLQSITARLQDAIAADMARAFTGPDFPGVTIEQADIIGYTNRNYEQGVEEAPWMSSPLPPPHYGKQIMVDGLRSPALGHTDCDFVEGDGPNILALQNQQFVVTLHAVQQKRPIRAIGHGLSLPTGSQIGAGSAIGTQVPIQFMSHAMHGTLLKLPVGAQNGAVGTFREFQLEPVPATEHVSLSRKKTVLSYKPNKREQNHTQAQAAGSSQATRKAASLQPVRQAATAQLSEANVEADVVLVGLSLKRKARSDDDEEQPTAGSVTEHQGVPDEQPRAKKQKYSALAGVEDAALPEYSHIGLAFSTRDAAVAAAAAKRVKDLEKSFTRVEQDTSIPQNDNDRQEAVQTLFGVMKDVSRAKDATSQAFKSRWAADSKRKYDDLEIETTCWEIVDLAERLHRDGPSALSIRDPKYVKHIKSSAHLTFAQRMRVIVTLAMQWKARNDGLIKGDTVQTVVAAPLETLRSAENNWKANQDRADSLTFAKKNKPNSKKRTIKTSKGKQVAHTIPDEGVNEEDGQSSRDEP